MRRGRRTRQILIAAVASAAAAAVLAVGWPGDRAAPGVGGNLALDGGSRFRSFDLLYAGTRFDGLPLVRVDRRLIRRPRRGLNPPVRLDYVSFIYGTCEASFGDCTPPLQIQVWPICLRNPSAYGPIDADGHRVGPADIAYEPLRIRGVPAAVYDAGTRLEVYTGSVTAVIFGARERIVRMAEELRGLNRRIDAHVPLSAPSPRALSTNCV